MTTTQQKELTAQLTVEADRRGLRLEHREKTRGSWVWDARDLARGNLAVRGVSLQELAKYLGTAA